MCKIASCFRQSAIRLQVVPRQLRQNSNTSQLIFNCFHLVSFVSTNMTLVPGDIILTGTPSGVGPIESGDRLEVRVQGLTPLVNTVK